MSEGTCENCGGTRQSIEDRGNFEPTLGPCSVCAAVTAPADDKSTQAENELIAERLLGWVRWQEPGEALKWKNIIDGGRGWSIEDTPTFTRWSDCGLILEAFERLHIGRAVSWQLHHCGDGRELHHVSLEWDIGDDASKYAQGEAATTPLAVRSAALSYLRSLER